MTGIDDIKEVSDLRCSKCEKLLAKHGEIHDAIQIKCNRCGTLNMFFEKSKEQIVITDPNGIIVFANNVTSEISGYEISEIIGATPSLWGRQMPKEFYDSMWNDIKNHKKSIVTEITNRHKNGKLYRAHLRISPVLDTSGEVKFFVGIESIIN